MTGRNGGRENCGWAVLKTKQNNKEDTVKCKIHYDHSREWSDVAMEKEYPELLESASNEEQEEMWTSYYFNIRFGLPEL